MKILSCSSGKITMELGEKFSFMVVEALGERTSFGFAIYENTLKQLKPNLRELTVDEKQAIKDAVLDWNSSVHSLSFI